MSTTTWTREQASAALALANDVRYRRSELRRELRVLPREKARAVLASAILEVPDWLATVDVHKLLLWLPGLGESTLSRWLPRIDVYEHRTLGGLSERQRHVLAGLLRDGARWARSGR